MPACTKEGEQARAKFLKFNAQTGTWAQAGPPVDVADTKTPVRLLATAPSRPKLLAVIPNAASELAVAEAGSPR